MYGVWILSLVVEYKAYEPAIHEYLLIIQSINPCGFTLEPD